MAGAQSRSSASQGAASASPLGVQRTREDAGTRSAGIACRCGKMVLDLRSHITTGNQIVVHILVISTFSLSKVVYHNLDYVIF